MSMKKLAVAGEREASWPRVLSKKDRKRAIRYLREAADIPAGSKSTDEIVRQLGQLRRDQAQVRRSRKDYYRALTRAYAAFAGWSRRKNRSKTIDKIADTLNLSPAERKDPLRVLCRAFINYDIPTDAEKKGARQYWSRDAKAIRHLMNRGIKPDEVEKLAEGDGEGIDAWARSSPEKRRRPKVAKKTEEARSGLRRLEKTIEDAGPGSRKLLIAITRQDAAGVLRVVSSRVLPSRASAKQAHDAWRETLRDAKIKAKRASGPQREPA